MTTTEAKIIQVAKLLRAYVTAATAVDTAEDAVTTAEEGRETALEAEAPISTAALAAAVDSLVTAKNTLVAAGQNKQLALEQITRLYSIEDLQLFGVDVRSMSDVVGIDAWLDKLGL